MTDIMTAPIEITTPLLTLTTHGGSHHAAISPDGSRVIVASYDPPPRLYDARTGRHLADLKLPFIRSLFARSDDTESEPLTAVTFSHDGRRALTAAYNAIRLWDAATGRFIATLEGASFHGAYAEPWELTTSVFSPIGRSVVMQHGDSGAFGIWSTRTGRRRLTVRAHDKPMAAVLFSPSGQHIVSAPTDVDSGIKVWHARNGRLAMTIGGRYDYAKHLSYSPDGRYLLSTWDARHIVLWDASTGQQHKTIETRFPIRKATFSPDGSKIVTQPTETHPSYGFDVLNAQTGELVCEISGHKAVVWTAHFSPDSRHLVTASKDGKPIVWDAETGAAKVILGSASHHLESAMWSPSADRILTCSTTSAAYIWDVSDVVGEACRRFVP